MQSREFTVVASTPLVHNFVDLTSRRFGRLQVIALAGRHVGETKLVWKCRCDCGNECYERGYQLTRGAVLSCGCLMIERTKQANTTHGYKGKRVYRIWSGMLNRIRNRNAKDYYRYGGRGIRVCSRWLKFDNFLSDMGEPTTNKHSIDRKDNDGDYEPGNCRWATAKEQANNRRPPFSAS